MLSMHPESLLADEDDIATNPATPAPLRQVRCAAALEHEQLAERWLERLLDNHPSRTGAALYNRIRKCRDEFRSWQLVEPTAEVRARVLDQFEVWTWQAASLDRGER